MSLFLLISEVMPGFDEHNVYVWFIEYSIHHGSLDGSESYATGACYRKT